MLVNIAKEGKMKTYDFTFVVDADPHADDFEDRFVEAGCDDATFLLMRGAAAISFDRTAESYKEAVFSAFKQIKAAGAQVLRFEPDFLVSATEIAERSGLSKAAIGLFGNGSRREGFPAPQVRLTAKSPLWDWVEVSHWLMQNGKVDESVYREALVSRIINAGAQINHISQKSHFDIEAALEAT
jgi:hypothetical protein